MAEPEQEKKTVASRVGLRENIFTRILRNLGILKRYKQTTGYDISEVPTFKTLNKKLGFEKIAALNNEMINAEQEWDGGTGTPHEKDNASNVMQGVFSLYKELKHFTDFEALLKEGDYAQNGTGPQEKKLKISIPGGAAPMEFTFHVPAEKTVSYRDIDIKGGRAYNLAFVGSANKTYFGDLQTNGLITREIFGILNAVQSEWITKHPTARNNIEENIGIHKTIVLGLLGEIQKHLLEFDENHRSFLVGGKGFTQYKSNYDTLAGDVRRYILSEEKVVYRHTYKILQSSYIDSQGHIHELSDLSGNYTDTDGIVHIKHAFPQTAKESEAGVQPGYDENGWPLEVAWPLKPTEIQYRFITEDGNVKNYEKGSILIDIFNKEGDSSVTVRKIDDMNFATDCDLVDMAAWVYVNYDAYRDDLRDGRYHADSDCITIMEKIMAEYYTEAIHRKGVATPSRLLNDENINDINSGKNAKVQIKLNPSGSITQTIRPSHLNPAFDLSVNEKAKHLGRKFYYDTQDHSAQSKKKTITTRGAALYILSRAVEEIKYWDEHIKLLEAIGEKTGGYDIGPNLGPKAVRWGQPLTKNPYRPISGSGVHK